MDWNSDHACTVSIPVADSFKGQLGVYVAGDGLNPESIRAAFERLIAVKRPDLAGARVRCVALDLASLSWHVLLYHPSFKPQEAEPTPHVVGP